MRNRKIILILCLILFAANIFAQQNTTRKSVAGALLRSAVVPGWGEVYAENVAAAKWTFSSEILVWASYLFFTSKSKWLADDYKNIALTYASVANQSYDKQYWIDVGESSSIYAHNQNAARRRDKEAIYTNIDHYYWFWQNENQRANYNHLRVKSGRFKDYAKIVISGVILTRVVSSVIAVRSVKRFNKKLKSNTNLSINVQPILDSKMDWIPSARITYTF